MCSLTATAQKSSLSDCVSVEDSVATIKMLLQQNESKFIGLEAKELFVQINTLFPIMGVVPIDTNAWNDPEGESYVEGVSISPYKEDDARHRIQKNIPYLSLDVYFEGPYETWDEYVERVPDNAFGKRELTYSNEKIVRKVDVYVVKFDGVPDLPLW
jgi:hypothetical protein